MHWIALFQKETDSGALEKGVWDGWSNCEVRNPKWEIQSVRHSIFVIRHCPDPHDATGRFDFVLANPPFNVNAVDKERLKDSVGPRRRYSFGLPRTDNANYLWIQLFHSALNEKGRAGCVMANSASDARASEQELHAQLN